MTGVPSARDCVADPSREALVTLAIIAEPPSSPLVIALAGEAPCAVLERLRRGELAGASPRAIAGLQTRLAAVDVARSLSLATRVGARFVAPGDDEWPQRLGDLSDQAPLGLWLRGRPRLNELVETSVAVVGARAATTYGVTIASELAVELTTRGATVVSGAAFGIDAAAHRGALSVSGPTVAVLACGIDRAYPLAHDELLRRIGEQGLVVSELAPGAGVTRGRFLVRNRLLAAMTCGTVVVEAAVRSGALNTATRARDLSRHVMAVPGPVTSAMSAGCHEEIRARAANLVTDAADVLDVVGVLGRDALGERREGARPLDQLTSPQLAVFDALPLRASREVDEVARSCGLGLVGVLAAMGRLHELGLVEPVGSGWARSVLGATAVRSDQA